MAKRQFKTESKRILDLFTNSIYTHPDIFLREVISNASDALDKRYYEGLQDESYRVDKKDLSIHLEINKDARTLTITDTGIGMTKDELVNNLGIIAKSGSSDFKKQLENNDDVDIIGQFGVGFYSSFMVAKKIIVESKSITDEKAYSWISSGEDGYEIKEIMKDTFGSKIIIELKDNTEDNNYDNYLETYQIKELIKKYSDYVRYPITMFVTKEMPAEEEGQEPKEVLELETLNSMIPVWKRNKKDITTEEYNDFYKSKFMDWTDPAKVLHYNIEGNISYTGLIFIPSQKPFNFYSSDFEGGLQLYSKGVFIQDKVEGLVPDYFKFAKGLVDSNDVSLNISREMLQKDRQLKLLSKSIEKKIKDALTAMLKNDREDYEKFFENFGLQLKYGLYQDYGSHSDKLKDLVLFKSSKEDKYITLKEYVERMAEGQDKIYYASGESIDKIKALPQIERILDKGFEVLFFTENVDEFAIQFMKAYEEKEFKSINQGDLDLDTDEEKEEIKKASEENKDLLTTMLDGIKDEVKEVRISSRLKTHPVCLVSEDGVSIEMEKVLAQNPDGQSVKATKILEINPNHEIFNTLKELYANNPEKVKDYASILYDQALLIEGLSISDPVEYANKICKLMTK
jgi:molecular chaperone HtpG